MGRDTNAGRGGRGGNSGRGGRGRGGRGKSANATIVGGNARANPDARFVR
jgi:hypothetical protein